MKASRKFFGNKAGTPEIIAAALKAIQTDKCAVAKVSAAERMHKELSKLGGSLGNDFKTKAKAVYPFSPYFE